MWLTFVFDHWKTACTLVLIAALAAYGQWMQHQRDAARAEFNRLQIEVLRARAVADRYRATTEKNIEILQTSIPVMVDQAGAAAVANFRKRFNGVACPPALGLPELPGGAAAIDPAAGAQGADAGQPDAVADPAEQLAEQCGRTTELFNQWRRWATLNQLPIKE